MFGREKLLGLALQTGSCQLPSRRAVLAECLLNTTALATRSRPTIDRDKSGAGRRLPSRRTYIRNRQPLDGGM